MKSGQWVIQKDALQLLAEDIYTPTANEVYNYVFNNSKKIKDIVPSNNLKSLLEGIDFSNYPLELAIEMRLDRARQKIFLNITAERDHILITLDDFFTRKADHIIINNTWYPFIKGTLKELRARLAEVKIRNIGDISLKQYLQARSIQDYLVRDLTPGQMNAKEIAKLKSSEVREHFFTGRLYPYQEEGYTWLAFMDHQDMGCILADEMGLGKTIQVIALLADYVSCGRPSLLIVPSTLLENWRREIAKFAPKIKAVIHQGSKRTGFAKEFKQYDLIITSYETVIRDQYMLKMIDWNIVVLDEAQAIKNPSAKRTKAVKSIPRRSAIAMSGTPVQNNLTDLWSITDFALPGLLGSLSSFEKEFVLDTASAEKIEPLVSPLMLRRRVQEVAKDLPEKIEIPQPLIMDRKASEEYEEIRRKTKDEYGDKATLVALTRMRMFCSHPSLLEDDTDDDPAQNSLKYRRLVELMEEIFANNEKMLVFTSWQKMTDIIVNDAMKRLGVYANKIDGRVDISERQRIVDKFNEMDNIGVLVLNPVAGGVGLNITGANHVVHYNLEWNPAVVDQATARAYRRGQKRPVTVHRLFYVDTVEDVINERLELKRNISNLAVVGVTGKEEDYEHILDALKRTPIHREKHHEI